MIYTVQVCCFCLSSEHPAGGCTTFVDTPNTNNTSNTVRSPRPKRGEGEGGLRGAEPRRVRRPTKMKPVGDDERRMEARRWVRSDTIPVSVLRRSHTTTCVRPISIQPFLLDFPWPGVGRCCAEKSKKKYSKLYLSTELDSTQLSLPCFGFVRTRARDPEPRSCPRGSRDVRQLSRLRCWASAWALRSVSGRGATRKR